jgi:hypothetical protein
MAVVIGMGVVALCKGAGKLRLSHGWPSIKTPRSAARQLVVLGSDLPENGAAVFF